MDGPPKPNTGIGSKLPSQLAPLNPSTPMILRTLPNINDDDVIYPRQISEKLSPIMNGCVIFRLLQTLEIHIFASLLRELRPRKRAKSVLLSSCYTDFHFVAWRYPWPSAFSSHATSRRVWGHSDLVTAGQRVSIEFSGTGKTNRDIINARGAPM